MTVRPSTTQPIGSDGSTHQHFAGPFILDEELMIVNGNGDGGALTIKGGPFCGESCGQGCSFMQGGDQES